MRQELILQDNDKIRVTVNFLISLLSQFVHFHCKIFQSLSPGVTETEIFETGGYNTVGPKYFDKLPAIKAQDLSSAVLYLLSTPYHLNVTEITLKHVMQKS